MKYFAYLISALIFFSVSYGVTAQAKTLADNYSYIVNVLPPFGPVNINNTITCPNHNEGAFCLVTNQAKGSVMTITGLGNHVCYLNIQNDGSVKIDEGRSVFCVIDTNPATPTGHGFIRLQQHF